MKSAIKISLFLLAGAAAFIANAEPIAVSMVADGYIVSGRHVATTEQLLGELQGEKSKEIVVSFAPDVPMDKLVELMQALQKQGMKVGFITSAAKQ